VVVVIVASGSGFRYHHFSTTIKAVTFDTVLDCNVVLLECEDEAPASYGSHWYSETCPGLLKPRFAVGE
jgi:hypothetical protein